MKRYGIVCLLLSTVALAACGFQPLYGDGQAGYAPSELAAIEVRPIDDRIGQRLHNHLLDILNPKGRPANPLYVLDVRLSPRMEHLAVAKSELATRANFRLSARYNLSGKKDGKTLASGDVVVVASYNILRSEFATLAAEKDANRRAVIEVGGEIRTRLAMYFIRGQGGGGDSGR